MTPIELLLIGFALGVVATAIIKLPLPPTDNKKKPCPEKGQDPLQKHGDL